MTTFFRLTWVRSVTIRIEHKDEEAVGLLPRHFVDQEQAGVDSRARVWKMGAHTVCQSFLVEAVTNHLPHLESLIIDLCGPFADFSPWTRSQATSDYLTSKIGGLRNICARTLRLSPTPEGTFYYWSCLDDTAVDFVKTTMNIVPSSCHRDTVMDVKVTSLPGGRLPPAIFDHMSRRLTFNTNTNIAGLEGLLLEKCDELGMFSKDEVEEKEIAAADTILTMMSSGMCVLYEVTMRKVVR